MKGTKGRAANATLAPPRGATGHHGGFLVEMQAAMQREAQSQQAVQPNETDDEGRHFTGQQRQEPRCFTRCAVSPVPLSPPLLTAEVKVRGADHQEVDPHVEVRDTEVGHRHRETCGCISSLKEQSVDQHTVISKKGPVGRKARDRRGKNETSASGCLTSVRSLELRDRSLTSGTSLNRYSIAIRYQISAFPD